MKLTEKDVLRIAELAKIDITNEVEKYHNELNAIFSSIEKIENSKIDGDIMINSSENKNIYFDADNIVSLEKEEIFKNSISNDGEFIIVPKEMK